MCSFEAQNNRKVYPPVLKHVCPTSSCLSLSYSALLSYPPSLTSAVMGPASCILYGLNKLCQGVCQVLVLHRTLRINPHFVTECVLQGHRVYQGQSVYFRGKVCIQAPKWVLQGQSVSFRATACDLGPECVIQDQSMYSGTSVFFQATGCASGPECVLQD